MMKSYRAPKAQTGNLLLLCFLAAAAALLSFGQPVLAAGEPDSIRLEVEGRPAQAEAPPVVEQGRTLVPLRFVAEALGARVTWEAASRRITVTAPPRRGGGAPTITLVSGQTVALVDGRPVSLEVPARLLANRAYVPLRFLAEALGAGIEWDEPARTVRLWRRQSLITDLSWQKEVGVARVHIALSEPVAASQVTVLENPDRLELTLGPAQVAAPRPAYLLLEPLFQGLRLEQDGRTARLVVDLNRPPVHTLVPDPDGLGYTLEFRYQITGIELRQDGRVPVVAILGDGPLDFQVAGLAEPARLVVDLKQASIGRAVPATLPAGQPGLLRVRSGQFTADTARVVVDLAQPLGYQVRRTDHGIFLRFPAYLTGINWEILPDRTRITLSASGPLDFQVQANPAQKRLTVSLPGAALGELSSRRTATGAAFTAITLLPGEAAAGTVQAILDLPYYIGHQVRSKAGDRQLVLDLIASPVSGKRIWIDAGHGGRDPGAPGPDGLWEKEVTLAVALGLRELLQAGGAQVHMSRVTDVDVDLHARPALANRAKVDAFISIHANSGGRTSSGTETYYWSNHAASQRLARTVHGVLVQGLGLPDRGVRAGNYVVLRETAMPSILVELAFLTHPRDAGLLADPQFQARAAEALQAGLFDYFRQETRP